MPAVRVGWDEQSCFAGRTGGKPHNAARKTNVEGDKIAFVRRKSYAHDVGCTNHVVGIRISRGKERFPTRHPLLREEACILEKLSNKAAIMAAWVCPPLALRATSPAGRRRGRRLVGYGLSFHFSVISMAAPPLASRSSLMLSPPRMVCREIFTWVRVLSFGSSS